MPLGIHTIKGGRTSCKKNSVFIFINKEGL